MAQQLGVADLLVRCLEREGVTVVFGIPGEENIGFVDALARSSIRYVLVRHEQAASFMAANPDTIVVLEAGNPVVMPWRDHKRCRSWVARVLAAGVTPGRHGPSAAGLPV